MSKLKEINLKITKNEYRALIAMIDNGYNVCQKRTNFKLSDKWKISLYYFSYVNDYSFWDISHILRAIF